MPETKVTPEALTPETLRDMFAQDAADLEDDEVSPIDLAAVRGEWMETLAHSLREAWFEIKRLRGESEGRRKRLFEVGEERRQEWLRAEEAESRLARAQEALERVANQFLLVAKLAEAQRVTELTPRGRVRRPKWEAVRDEAIAGDRAAREALAALKGDGNGND